MNKNNDQKRLPKDLRECELMLLDSIKSALDFTNNRLLSIDLKLNGIKTFPLIFRLLAELNEIENKIIISFSDYGSAALAKRDYPLFKNNINTFKEIINMDNLDKDSLIIVDSPQPYDYELFEQLTNNVLNRIIMVNGKLEETAIGVGFVGRERRIKFIKAWFNIFWLESIPYGAVMHQFPFKWNVYKKYYDGYRHVKEYDHKPDNDSVANILIE